MKVVVIALTVLLVILHQDFWWWDSREVVLGFLPVGLAWHAGISLAAGFTGWLAVTWCWPHELDEVAEETAAVSPLAADDGGETKGGSAT